MRWARWGICDCGGEGVEHNEERHVYLRDYGWIPDSYRPRHMKSHASGRALDLALRETIYEPRHKVEKTVVVYPPAYVIGSW